MLNPITICSVTSDNIQWGIVPFLDNVTLANFKITNKKIKEIYNKSLQNKNHRDAMKLFSENKDLISLIAGKTLVPSSYYSILTRLIKHFKTSNKTDEFAPFHLGSNVFILGCLKKLKQRVNYKLASEYLSHTKIPKVSYFLGESIELANNLKSKDPCEYSHQLNQSIMLLEQTANELRLQIRHAINSQKKTQVVALCKVIGEDIEAINRTHEKTIDRISVMIGIVALAYIVHQAWKFFSSPTE